MIIHRVIRTVRRFQGWVGGGAVVCLIVGLYLGLIGSPPDYYQGEVVRIMYIHVPLAHTSLLGYLALAVGSAWYLWKRDPLADNVCHAVAALSAAFTALALATGMIWGKPTWNTWWTWDARLTSYTVMLFILIGYLMLRTVIDDPEKEARYAAVLALIGLVDLPIIHFSVEWWRTLHQPQSISLRGVSISSGLLVPLACMSIGISLLFSYMLMIRTQQLYLTRLLHAKKGRLLSQFHLSKSDT